MLATRNPVLRRFRSLSLTLEGLDAGPRPFRLLVEDIALWRAADGRPDAASATRTGVCWKAAGRTSRSIRGPKRTW
jgi:hypothetical protein